jgi:hypothetical protein
LRKASGFPVDARPESSKRLCLVWRGEASLNSAHVLPERQSLSAHLAAQPQSRQTRLPYHFSLNREVSRFRMMYNDRRSRLFWFELKFFAQLYIDPRRVEQLKQLGLVFEIRAGPDETTY